jgi:hypothetical protein
LQYREVRREKPDIEVGINQTGAYFIAVPWKFAFYVGVAIVNPIVVPSRIESIQKKQSGNNLCSIED